MAFWDNDPIVETSTASAPWESDPIVTAAPKEPTLADMYKDESFQRLPEDKQVAVIKKQMQKEGKINEEGYRPNSLMPSFAQKLLPTDKEAKIERKFNYALGPENQARRAEVLKRSLAAPINTISDAATQLGSAVSGNPYSQSDLKSFQEHRKSQAELDELQSRTADTEGFQTVPAIGASLPLAEVRPLQGASKAIPAIGGWLRNIGIIGDSSIQGAIAGKTLTPTSSATTPKENPEEAAKNYEVQSSKNTTTGAVIGAAVPAGATVTGKLAGTAKVPLDWLRQIAGSTKEAEGRAASKFEEAYSATRGTPVQAKEISKEIEQGTQRAKDINKEFGTNFEFTTSQAAGDSAASGMEKSFEKNIAKGIGSSNNDIANIGTKAQKNREEMAKLIGQTGKDLSESKVGAVEATAKEVGEKPLDYVLKTYKPVDFDDLDKVVALKKFNQNTIENMETAKKNYDSLYKEAADPQALQIAKKTRKAIKDNIEELNQYGVLTKADKKIIGDFYGESGTSRKNSAKELVELNASLSELASRTRSDPKLAPAYELVQEIRSASKEDLAASPIKNVAEKAKQANDLFKSTQSALYERPDDFLGKKQPTALAELRKKAGTNTSLEDETTNNLTRTSEDIADVRRAEQFVKGSSAQSERDAKNVLMAEAKDALKSNPSPATFDTWASKNATRIGSIPGFKREMLGMKASLVKEEQNIATAQKIMGGRDEASKAVKSAMNSPQKMQELVDLADKDPTGDTLLGLKKLFYDEIETGSMETVVKEGGKATRQAGSNAYFDNLLDNAETQKALKILWKDDAKNLETASDLFKRLSIERSKGLRAENLADKTDREINKTIAAQSMSGARGISINAISNVLSDLTDREFNRVMARALSDPEYATKILNAYEKPTEANLKILTDIASKASLPVNIEQGKSKGRANPKMNPEALKKPKEEGKTINKTIVEPMGFKFSIEGKKPDKVPYKEEYSKMLGKLPSNEHRRVANFVIEEANRQGVEQKLALNVANAESNFNINAKAGTTSANGLFQITKGTEKEIKEKILKDEKLNLNDAKGNAKAGIAYIKHIRDKIEKSTGKKAEPYLIYTGYHSGLTGVLTLLDPKNQKKAAAELLPAAAKANRTIYFNPNGRPYTVKKVRQNLKDYFESKRLD